MIEGEIGGGGDRERGERGEMRGIERDSDR